MARLKSSRRRFLQDSVLSLGALAVSGCDRLSGSPSFRRLLDSADALTMRGQRLLIGGQALAREFTAADISPAFRANGTSMPADEAYQRLLQDRFADWRLQVDGEVERPASYSLAELQRLPSRTQITRHDCVEGWSAIARWQGVPAVPAAPGRGAQARGALRRVPLRRHLRRHAHKGGDERAGRYYESIDLIDAFHPQTILAYSLNGGPLPVENGAPLRLRVERQLGYKQAKYLMRVEITSRLDLIGEGRGGFWEDRGYEWYAGI